MKRQPVEILHSFVSGTSFWVQVRFHKSAEVDAVAAVFRRARTAAWDPDGAVRFTDETETKNWITREYWFSTPLPLAKMLTIQPEELETEAALVRNHAEHIRKMRDRRVEYQEQKNPLFAAMGALDEVCQEPSYLTYLFERFEGEMARDVGDAASQQQLFRDRDRVAALLGVETMLELEAYAWRTFPKDPGYQAHFWADTLRNPEAKLENVRIIAELQRRNNERFRGGLSPHEEAERSAA